jgi:hypothetical protein
LIASALVFGSAALADEHPPPLPPPSAPVAEAAGPVDAVHLRNGGLYRGHVTEIVPGDHVTIYVEHGDQKKIPWSEIDRVIVATTPIPPAPSSSGSDTHAIPPATPPVSAPMVGPKVRVHVSAPSTVILYRRPAGTTSWTQACTSPCNIDLPINDSYRVVGNNVAQSGEFTLGGAPGGSVDLKVDPQSVGGMVMGGLIGGAGALIGYVGLLVTLVSLGDDTSENKDARGAGLVMMALGGLATVGGVLLFVASAKTDVTTTASGGAPSGSNITMNDAWKRVPTWRTAEAGAAPAQFPIMFSHAF